MKHAVIYIPGIRDDFFKFQSGPLPLWRLWGVRAKLHAMPWAGSGSYENKFQRLLEVIDEQRNAGYIISLMGASAGASAALNAYVARKNTVHSVVFICAKLNRPAAVSEHTYRANPAFQVSMQQVQANLSQLTPLDKCKMRSFYSPTDRTVPHKDTIIPGVAEEALPAIGHGKAIIYSLTFGTRRIAHFIKLQATATHD